jgi:hypothetical protein
MRYLQQTVTERGGLAQLISAQFKWDQMADFSVAFLWFPAYRRNSPGALLKRAHYERGHGTDLFGGARVTDVAGA